MLTYPADLEAYIQEKLASGEFASKEAFTIAAARLYRDVETARAQLQSDIAAAISESEQGLSVPLDIEQLKAELIDELDEFGKPKAS